MRRDPKSFPNSVRDAVQELWGLGYAVVPLPPLPELLELPKPPVGMAYQWSDKPTLEGWTAVSCTRHPGLFAPLGSSDDICVHHLYLHERPKADVDAAHQANRDKAQAKVDDWYKRAAADGLSGTVTVLGESHKGAASAEVVDIGDEGPSLRTKIPSDMFEHLAELLKERDRLVEQSVKAAPGDFIPKMASLRASCLELAIDMIRKKYAAPAAEQEASNG